MNQNVVNLGIALFLAVANQAIVDALANPIRKKYPNLDMWWLFYVSLATGFVIGWFSGVNIFDGYIDGLLGQIMTALCVGGGASLIHDIFDAVKG